MNIKKYYNDNLIEIYNCDNLELLKSLPNESINLIYCDILYNTGKVFDDYNDNLGSAKEAIEWYKPRIIEMKRVLKNNGSIFLHCNWRLDSYIRILMDEIFGFNHFRNRIYRKHSKTRGFVNNFDSQVDVILYYVKDIKNFIFNEMKDDKEKLFPLYENGYIKERSIDFTLGNFKVLLKERNKHLLIPLSNLKELYNKNEIMIIDNYPYRKTYSNTIGNLWDDEAVLDKYNRNKISDTYDTPKPEEILDKIISICSNEGDVVADFFLGGGTTAVVCKKRKRKGIFCDINKKACDVTINKLKDIK